jgi:hypothetical protein
MLYTLADAREKVKAFVDGGSCSNTTIDARINEAIERLATQEAWDCMSVNSRIGVCNACFPLPYRAESILACDIDGTPAQVRGRYYQFLSSGPGDLDYRGGASVYRDLVDMGDQHAVMYDLPHIYENTVDSVTTDVDATAGLKVAAFCTDTVDVGTTLKIYGYKDGARLVRTGSAEGEDITVKRWSGGEVGSLAVGVVDGEWIDNVSLSTNAFTDISRVVKATTAGSIYLYAIDESTNRMFFLAAYEPRQTIAQFRRYRITNKSANVDVSHVYALLKLRVVPLANADDILPIDSMQAVKLMVMAISEENKMNLPMAQALEEKAIAVLAKKEESRTMTGGTPVILDSDYRTSLGAKMNRRVLI